MKKVLGKDGKVLRLEMTKAEWKAKGRDYKGGRLGKDARAMCLDTDGATVLVPVTEVKPCTN